MKPCKEQLTCRHFFMILAFVHLCMCVTKAAMTATSGRLVNQVRYRKSL